MDTAAVLLRLAVALVSVLGLVWLFSRGMMRGRGGRMVPGATEVLARQQISRAASVVVVRVGDKALVLGVTEQQVNLLGETDLPEPDQGGRRTESIDLTADADAVGALVPAPRTEDDVARNRPRRSATRAKSPRAPDAPGSALAGSALSPATWTQALDVLRERTTRR